MRDRIILLIFFFQNLGDRPAKISEINKYLESHDIYSTDPPVYLDLKALEHYGFVFRSGIGNGTKYWRGKL